MLCACASVPSVSNDITVIVPVLNELANLPRLIQELTELNAAQTIIVDGGSHDGTVEQLEQQCPHFELIASEPGRAQQMNAGAELAAHDMLLFLHADTQLPSAAQLEIARAEFWGRFDVRFDSRSLAMQVIAGFMNARSRLTGIATGDQAIFVKRGLFESLGGYPLIPLMEDIALSKQLNRQHTPLCSRAKVTTSARRWRENGVLKTVLKMWWLRLTFALGVSAHRLERDYHDVR